MSLTFTMDFRRVHASGQTLTFKVEVYRLKLLGITVWKWERLH